MVKKEIRSEMLNKRSSLENKDKLDKLIYQNIIEFSKDYKTIAIFHSFKDEINTLPIIETLLKQNKRVACPKIINKKMNFYEIKSLNDFKLGYFDIMEPVGDVIIEPESFDLIIVPLLAYNDGYYRVGYGGGFYDRFLAKTNAFKIGLAYDLQYINKRFEMPHDIALDGIVNNKEIKLK